MGEGADDRNHFLGEPAARKSVDDSGGEARSQTVIHRLVGGACLLAARPGAAMKSKTNRSSLGCRSVHVCPCCPRTPRFSALPREQFGVLGKLPTFLRRSLVSSDSESVTLIPHRTHETCLVFAAASNPREEDIKTLPTL